MQRDAPSTPSSAGGAGRSRQPAARWLVPSRWIGPLATGAAVALIVLVRMVVPISSPGPILLVFVAISAVLAGIGPALVSATIVVVFVALDASAPGRLFAYDSAALSRLVVNGSTAVVMAALVGGIQRRLAAQRELVASQRSEDRQRALTDPASEAILTIDASSVILAANPASAELFGYPLDEIVGSSVTKLMAPAYRGRHFDALARYLRTGRRTIPWQGAELRALHASGRKFPVEVSIGEYGSGPDRRFTGIVRDISRRKDIEAKLLQSQKMDAIGRLAGGVAHDFNNLLTAIGGHADDEAAPTVSAPQPPALAQARGHGTILVAEDEAVVREMVVASLERLGYRVMAASTGEEAVRLIDRLGDEIDLLLSDVVMPGMSGPDLYDRARRTRPDLPAIFMSGYTALSMGRPIPAGITLLEKPFSVARLDQVVRETLTRR
jgi:PAS domain S-box-containing protein